MLAGTTSAIAATGPFAAFEAKRLGNSMIFSIEVELTDKGVSQWTHVVGVIFHYLDMLRKSKLPAYLHEEGRQIGQMSFQFLQEKELLPSA